MGVKGKQIVFQFYVSENGTRLFLLEFSPFFFIYLQRFELKIERNKLLSLQGVILNPKICETLEEILKHIQFFQINLESTALDDEVFFKIFYFFQIYLLLVFWWISNNNRLKSENGVDLFSHLFFLNVIFW